MRETVPPPGMLTASQAAGRAGLKRGTWSGYVARRQAPQPDARDPAGGNPLWRESTIDAWVAARAGQGARTDLATRDGGPGRPGEGEADGG